MGEAVADFVWVKYAVKKTLAKLLVRGLNALHLDNVDADAENHFFTAKFPKPEADLGLQTLDSYFDIKANMAFTAASIPVITARLTMPWPIFNSTKCGTRKSAGRFS